MLAALAALLLSFLSLHAGLDRFGRLQDLHYRQGSPSGSQPLLTRLQYTYDLAGNRLSAIRTPRPQGTDPATRQEQVNDYDDPHRLIESGQTDFSSANAPTLVELSKWSLDPLSNIVALERSRGGSFSQLLGFESNHRNAYTLLEDITNNVPQPDTRPVYDAAENLAFDGQYAYQYDAWNRLVQVNRATLSPTDPQELAYLQVGPMVKHFTYDAFGRLVRTQSPYPDPDDPDGLRSERFYYDGVRRVQEVVSDPLSNLNMAISSEDPQLQAAAVQIDATSGGELDGSATPATLETLELGGPGYEVLPLARVEREYVWGPGDWGVDELLAQYDVNRRASWPMQDAGGDVIGLLDRGGANGTARVVSQITYDPYGRVLSHEHLHPHAFLHAGHKGLFFDRRRRNRGPADPRRHPTPGKRRDGAGVQPQPQPAHGVGEVFAEGSEWDSISSSEVYRVSWT
jgi:hypothetical protein